MFKAYLIGGFGALYGAASIFLAAAWMVDFLSSPYKLDFSELMVIVATGGFCIPAGILLIYFSIQYIKNTAKARRLND